MDRAIVVGCGLAGSVIARYLAEEKGYKVDIYERRNHIGGNMYDYFDENGVLVHKYGPHTFHTNKKELYDYICKYGEWRDFKLTCGAEINGKYVPTPFNFIAIDAFFSEDKANAIKEAINTEFPNRKEATVLELLNHDNPSIHEYAKFLFDNDYSLYTAKQWGISPNEIDPSVLARVPIRFNYAEGYFDDEFQVMPKHSYEKFFKSLLMHENIVVHLSADAKKHLYLDDEVKKVYWDNEEFSGPLIFTGPIDELFDYRYGKLPYRSLRFEWKSEPIKSFQNAPVVAYPQESGYTRITEYTKLPVQDVGEQTVYAIEYPVQYEDRVDLEPYYPIPTDDNQELFEKYKTLADSYDNIFLCGRLATYKYYNMDQVLNNALHVCRRIN